MNYAEYAHAIKTLHYVHKKQLDELQCEHTMYTRKPHKCDYMQQLTVDYLQYKRLSIDIRYTYLRLQYLREYYGKKTHNYSRFRRIVNAYNTVVHEYTRIAFMYRNLSKHHSVMRNYYVQTYHRYFADVSLHCNSGYSRYSEEHFRIVCEQTDAMTIQHIHATYGTYDSEYMVMYDVDNLTRYIKRDNYMQYLHD